MLAPGSEFAGSSTPSTRSADNKCFRGDHLSMGPLLSVLYPPRIELLVVKRLSALFPELAGTFESTNWNVVFASLRRLPPHPAMCVMKSYLNAWANSVIFHEDQRLSCVLGCANGVVSLSPYISCPELWRMVSVSVVGEVAGDMIGRLAVAQPSADHFLNLSIVFPTKVSERSLLDLACGSGNFDGVVHAACAHARVDAISLGCLRRHWERRGG